MAMSEHALSYGEEAYYEQRRLRVLSGSAAREKANARRIDLVKVTLALCAVLIYFLAVTFMAGQINLVSSEINQIKSQIADTENETRKAELEIGQLSSLNRIEDYAVARLDMVVPPADQAYYLGEEASIAIAQANSAVQVAGTEAEDPLSQPEEGFFRSVGALFADYFSGTAMAITEESAEN